MKSKNKWRGGYSRSNFKSTRHGDGRTSIYIRDQVRQFLGRNEERQVRLDNFLAREDREWCKLLKPVEAVLNDVVIDRTGNSLTIEAREALLAERLESRAKFRRPGGKMQRLRSQPYARGPEGEALRDANGKKIRIELPADEVKVIFHLAIQRDPRLSRMLVLAARDGKGELTKQFEREGLLGAMKEFEAATGLETVCGANHSKTLSGHPQFDYVLVDSTGKKLGANSFVNLHRKMLGVDRWRQMGIKGEYLDRLTGVENADAGLDEALKERGEKALDKKLQDALDAAEFRRVRTPTYMALIPYFEEAEIYYSDYLRRRAEAVSGIDAEARKRIAELEAARNIGEEQLRAERASREIETQAARDEKIKADAKVVKLERDITNARLDLANKTNLVSALSLEVDGIKKLADSKSQENILLTQKLDDLNVQLAAKPKEVVVERIVEIVKIQEPPQKAFLPALTNIFVTQIADIQKRLFSREKPSPEEIIYLQPVKGCAGEYALREDIVLEIARGIGNRIIGAQCLEIITTQQSMLTPFSKQAEFDVADQAVQRRLQNESPLPGDERYFTDKFVGYAKCNPDIAFYFLESFSLHIRLQKEKRGNGPDLHGKDAI